MKIIKLSYSNGTSIKKPMLEAIELSKWLQAEYNLIKDVDYDWCFISKNKEFHLRFFGNRQPEFESMESYLILKWQDEFTK